MFITFLQMGLANGVQPLLGYNFGSGNRGALSGLQLYQEVLCDHWCSGHAAVFVLRRSIIGLFIQDEEVIYYGVKMLIAYMLSGSVIGILFINMNCMQSVGKAFWATLFSILRQGLLLIPLLFILNALGGRTESFMGRR